MSDKAQLKPVEITQEGLEDLKTELEELQDVKLPKIIERVALAREQGDLSENADYHSAKDEQSFVENRISEIEDVISRAKVVKKTTSTTKVGMGSKVQVVIRGNEKKEFTFEIVSEYDSDPGEGKISLTAPLGNALMGKKKGDNVVVEAPAGKITYIIKDIK